MHDLREDPQLILKISQVVGPLQGYIRRPSHGERYMKKIGGMKPMISYATYINSGD